MTESLAHRGPDGHGCFTDSHGGLGFRRLSLIDLERGQQPVANEDGSLMSVCNGELFDYRAIACDLRRRGHRLQSSCDTELLPHLFEERGIDLLDSLAGQFAFAIYDRPRRRMYLARDHFGICPLYYTQVDGLLLFASEIKALLTTRRVPRAVDLTGLDQLLSFPGVVSPQTMFKGIHSLAPGHWLCVSDAGVTVREYWDLEYPTIADAPPPAPEREHVERVREALLKGVERRLIADVPVGCYLSGGLDSAVVAGMAAAIDPATPRHTFSISFGGSEMCEQRYQQRMAQRTRSIHHDIPMALSDVTRRLTQAIHHAECPIKETHDTACLALSQSAREHGVRAALTGQGADELFAGYIGYRFDEMRGERAHAVDPEERRLREMLWGDATFVYDGDYAGTRRQTLALYSPALRASVDSFDAFTSLPIRKSRLAGRDALQKRSYLDFKLRLGDHLLTDHGDRMAMAYGVEVRHPFLDLDLVRAVQAMPSALKVRDGEEKYLLKQAVRDYVDPSIVSREKFGWYTPGSPALLRTNDPYFTELLAPETIARQGYFDPAAVERLKQTYLADGFMLNQPYESDLLTTVLTFGIFLDVFALPAVG
jgi:asparagine synthase (glutamine-hydrolysing)